MRIVITGTGTYAPARIVTNEEMAKMVDTTDDWIQSRTGIKTRHLIEKEGEETTVDMAEHAALKALEACGAKACELDIIIFTTVTPDYRLPSAACLLQERLGAVNAFAFDIVAACAGSLYGLSVAEKFLLSKSHKKALVIGAECMSVIINWTDRNTCVLFGDAASAAILEPNSYDKNKGILDIKLYSDGRQWSHIWIKGGGSKMPLTSELVEKKADRIVMNGRETYKFAVNALTNAAKKILEKNSFESDDLNHVVAHQANLRIIEAVAKRIKVPLEKFVINIDRYANTSSASLLATFDEGKREGRFKSGDLMLMLSIGSGFTWGAGLYMV